MTFSDYHRGFYYSYIILTLLFLSFNLLIFLPGLLNNVALYEFAKDVFRPVCRNFPHRGFVIVHIYAPICSRCMGVFNGTFTALIFYPIYLINFPLIKSNKYLLFFLFPFIIQIMLKFFGIDFSIWSRFISGFLTGVIIPLMFLDAADSLFNT